MTEPAHIGRFAPSPTGPLHMGSLVAAVGSWLCARKHDGRWLLRIEDLDPPRQQEGAVEQILEALEEHHLFWDRSISFQSDRHTIYQDVVNRLLQQNQAYFCQCSRKQLGKIAKAGDMGPVYPGTCREQQLQSGAVRLRVTDELVCFDDPLACPICPNPAHELPDFVTQRRDTLFAYQLAVVVDDAWQGITDVVRGVDLLDNTPRQIYLQRLLGLPTPRYLHLPLVTNAQGQKLSKQNHAPALDNRLASQNMLEALSHLGFQTKPTLEGIPPADLLGWALQEADWSRTALSAYAS